MTLELFERRPNALCICRYGLTWEQQGKIDSLGSYYLNTIDALYPICPGCLFLIEGGGQVRNTSQEFELCAFLQGM